MTDWHERPEWFERERDTANARVAELEAHIAALLPLTAFYEGPHDNDDCGHAECDGERTVIAAARDAIGAVAGSADAP